MVFSQILIYAGPKLKKRVTKANKDFAKQLDLDTQNFQSKLQIHTKLKKRIPLALVFWL